jgi:hypothetical protein
MDEYYVQAENALSPQRVLEPPGFRIMKIRR